MKILHTSDWHLGKNLEGISRLEEQEQFLNELIEISNEREIDIIIIAGDIYDTYNPSAGAENLFYNYIKKLSNGGNRLIIINAGNHDNPERLVASKPFAKEHGVIIFGSPNGLIETGDYGKYQVTNTESGYFQINVDNQNINFVNIAYPGERVINELISNTFDEAEMQKNYSEKIKSILDKKMENLSTNDINVIIGHIYINGGKTTDSERQIQLGGTLSVDIESIPKVDYVALGHLHRQQSFKEQMIHYSGSPIQYSKSEINYKKVVIIIEFNEKREKNIEKVELTNYKPIEVWKTESIEEAIEKCEENQDRNCFVYLNVKTDRVITKSELKEMKRLKKDIVSIIPELTGEKEEKNYDDLEDEKDYTELFKEYYFQKKQTYPDEKVVNKFTEMIIGDEI